MQRNGLKNNISFRDYYLAVLQIRSCNITLKFLKSEAAFKIFVEPTEKIFELEVAAE